MKSLHDIFEHRLLDAYAAERQGLRQLQQMRQEAREDALKDAVEAHVSETEEQIRRLDGVFETLHLRKRTTTCHVLEGFTAEKREFLGLGPAPPLVDVYNADATVKTEAYEVATYEALVALAEQMGATDVVEPLRASLDEERRMLERVREVQPQLLRAIDGAAAQPKRTTPT